MQRPLTALTLPVWTVAALGWASATGWLFQLLPALLAGVLSLGVGMLLARAAEARVRRLRRERWKAEVRAERLAERR
ncbi:MAG TPA: hypothetical protein VHG51_14655 [Longimicrobiaceae bacterium]|nr:hypothetical protein [Longimicrobiaceae bacterium]